MTAEPRVIRAQWGQARRVKFVYLADETVSVIYLPSGSNLWLTCLIQGTYSARLEPREGAVTFGAVTDTAQDALDLLWRQLLFAKGADHGCAY